MFRIPSLSLINRTLAVVRTDLGKVDGGLLTHGLQRALEGIDKLMFGIELALMGEISFLLVVNR
jgi:hypothetical protein